MSLVYYTLYTSVLVDAMYITDHGSCRYGDAINPTTRKSCPQREATPLSRAGAYTPRSSEDRGIHARPRGLVPYSRASLASFSSLAVLSALASANA